MGTGHWLNCVAPCCSMTQVMFQCMHTMVFGWYATFLFLRTGTLAAPVACHTFCNWLGFPNFGHMAQQAGSMRAVALATAASIAGFVVLFGPLTRQDLYPSGPLVVRYVPLVD